jgi:catechol 2,3-dioxygenase-like lactoylglutathione lyase family enzyme
MKQWPSAFTIDDEIYQIKDFSRTTTRVLMRLVFARPCLKIRAHPGRLRMNETRRNKKETIVATTQEAVQISAIVPTLTVDDLQKSIAFYEALGFVIDERWEENGTLLGVMLRAGRTQIGLNQDDWKKGRDRKKGIGVRVSISTLPGSVDEIAKRARNAGITLTSDPHDTEWKSRAFEVSDPSGFLLTIFSEASA